MEYELESESESDTYHEDNDWTRDDASDSSSKEETDVKLDCATNQPLDKNHVVVTMGKANFRYNIDTILQFARGTQLMMPPFFSLPMTDQFYNKLLKKFANELKMFAEKCKNRKKKAGHDESVAHLAINPNSQRSAYFDETDTQLRPGQHSFEDDHIYVQRRKRYRRSEIPNLTDAYWEQLADRYRRAPMSGDLVVCPLCYSFCIRHEPYVKNDFQYQANNCGLTTAQKKQNIGGLSNTLAPSYRDPMTLLGNLPHAANFTFANEATLKTHLERAHNIPRTLLSKKSGCPQLLKLYKLRAGSGLCQKYCHNVNNERRKRHRRKHRRYSSWEEDDQRSLQNYWLDHQSERKYLYLTLQENVHIMSTKGSQENFGRPAWTFRTDLPRFKTKTKTKKTSSTCYDEMRVRDMWKGMLRPFQENLDDGLSDFIVHNDDEGDESDTDSQGDSSDSDDDRRRGNHKKTHPGSSSRKKKSSSPRSDDQFSVYHSIDESKFSTPSRQERVLGSMQGPLSGLKLFSNEKEKKEEEEEKKNQKDNEDDNSDLIEVEKMDHCSNDESGDGSDDAGEYILRTDDEDSQESDGDSIKSFIEYDSDPDYVDHTRTVKSKSKTRKKSRRNTREERKVKERMQSDEDSQDEGEDSQDEGEDSSGSQDEDSDSKQNGNDGPPPKSSNDSQNSSKWSEYEWDADDDDLQLLESDSNESIEMKKRSSEKSSSANDQRLQRKRSFEVGEEIIIAWQDEEEEDAQKKQKSSLESPRELSLSQKEQWLAKIIGIHYNNQTARVKVNWAGNAGTSVFDSNDLLAMCVLPEQQNPRMFRGALRRLYRKGNWPKNEKKGRGNVNDSNHKHASTHSISSHSISSHGVSKGIEKAVNSFISSLTGEVIIGEEELDQEEEEEEEHEEMKERRKSLSARKRKRRLSEDDSSDSDSDGSNNDVKTRKKLKRLRRKSDVR
eukprot:g2603.t1